MVAAPSQLHRQAKKDRSRWEREGMDNSRSWKLVVIWHFNAFGTELYLSREQEKMYV